MPIDAFSSAGSHDIFSSSDDPFENYLPTPQEKAQLPTIESRLNQNTLETNVTKMAQEDPAGFVEKVGRFASGGFEGLRYGYNYGIGEQFWRTYRTLGHIFGNEAMQETATEELNRAKEDPDRLKAMDSLQDPVARQAFEGMASVMPSLVTLVPTVVAGLLTGGAGWIPGLVGAVSAGGTAGLAEYDSFIENAMDELNSSTHPGISRNETRELLGDKAVWSALAEGGVDGALNVLGGRLARGIAKPLVTTGTDGTLGTFNRNAWGRLLKNLATQPVQQVPGEMATAGLQDYIKKISGLSHEGTIEAMHNALVPALIGSLPFAAVQSVAFSPSKATQDINATQLLDEVNTKIKMAREAYTKAQVDGLMNLPEIKAFVGTIGTDTGKPPVTLDLEAVKASRDQHIPYASDEQAAALANIVVKIDTEGFNSLTKQANEAGLTPLPEPTEAQTEGTLAPEEKFKEYLLGNKKNLSPEEQRYFDGVAGILEENLTQAKARGLLDPKAIEGLDTLKARLNHAFDPEYIDRYRRAVEGNLKTEELGEKISKEAFADIENPSFAKDSYMNVLTMKKEDLDSFIAEGGMFTPEFLANSKDPAVEAFISYKLGREIAAEKGVPFDPLKAADGKTISNEQISQWLQENASRKDTDILLRSHGLLANLQDNEMIAGILSRKSAMFLEASRLKLVRAGLADSNITMEQRTALAKAAQESFSLAVQYGAQRAAIGTWAGRSLQQMKGRRDGDVAKLINELGETIPQLLSDPNTSMGLLNSQVQMVIDVARAEGVPLKRQTEVVVKNLEAAVEAIKAAAEANPNLTLQEARKVIKPLDSGMDDGILEKVINVLNDPEINKKFIEQQEKSFWGFVGGVTKEFAYNNMLSSPKTATTSLLSQAVGTFGKIMEKAIGGSMWDIDTKKHGVSTKEWKWALSGIMQSLFGRASRGAINVLTGKSLRTYAEGSENLYGIENRVESSSSHEKFISSDRIAKDLFGKTTWEELVNSNCGSGAIKLLGKLLDVGGSIIRTPSRLLEATDELAEVSIVDGDYNSRLNAWKEQTGKDESQLTPDEHAEMMRYAINGAKAITFKEDLRVGDGWFRGAAAKIDELRQQSLVFQLGLPFFRVGVNIAYRFATSNPVTARFTKYHKDAMVSRDPRRIAEADARVVLGSALTYGAVMLASMGLITGAAPVSKEERELWEAAGNQAYSIRFGDTWISYQRSDPIASFLQTAANMTDAASHLSKKDLSAGMGTLFAMATLSTFDKTYFKGLHGILDALMDPKASAAAPLENALSMFVPAGSLVRSFNGMSTQNALDAANVFERMTLKYTPFDVPAEDVGIRRTALGDPIQTPQWRSGEALVEGSSLARLGALAIPSEFRSAKSSKTYDELFRLSSRGLPLHLGDSTYMTFRSRDGKHNIQQDLTMQEQSRFKELRGQQVTIRGRTLKESLENLFSDPRYLAQDDEKKADVVNRITRNYTNLARVVLEREFPDIIRRSN